MITKIELTNFKSHAHTVIEPGRVTALVGPNGCGKTGFLQGLHSLNRIISESPRQIFDGELSPEVLVRGQENEFSIRIELGTESLELKFSADNIYGNLRLWRLKGQGISMQRPFETDDLPMNQWSSLTAYLPRELILKLGLAEYFKALPSKLSQPSSIDEYPPKLNSDGSGLSSVIANLILSEPERLQIIEKALRGIVPTIKKIKARHKKIPGSGKTLYIDKGQLREVPYSSSEPGYEMIFDTLSADAIPAHSISEGTLLILGMLTLIQSPNPPMIFLLEDVEQGLHPLAQRKLIQVLKDFAEKHDRQIIITSHSPYIIDELPAEDIWVMATDKDGISHTRRLSEHPDAERALSVLTTGEFASAEGEEWVIEENSPTETVNA